MIMIKFKLLTKSQITGIYYHYRFIYISIKFKIKKATP